MLHRNHRIGLLNVISIFLTLQRQWQISLHTVLRQKKAKIVIYVFTRRKWRHDEHVSQRQHGTNLLILGFKNLISPEFLTGRKLESLPVIRSFMSGRKRNYFESWDFSWEDVTRNLKKTKTSTAWVVSQRWSWEGGNFSYFFYLWDQVVSLNCFSLAPTPYFFGYLSDGTQPNTWGSILCPFR